MSVIFRLDPPQLLHSRICLDSRLRFVLSLTRSPVWVDRSWSTSPFGARRVQSAHPLKLPGPNLFYGLFFMHSFGCPTPHIPALSRYFPLANPWKQSHSVVRCASWKWLSFFESRSSFAWSCMTSLPTYSRRQRRLDAKLFSYKPFCSVDADALTVWSEPSRCPKMMQLLLSTLDHPWSLRFLTICPASGGTSTVLAFIQTQSG